jgi:hypothetical protein
VEVEAITVGKHHDMRRSPNMGHDSAIVFHNIYLSWMCEREGSLSINEKLSVKRINNKRSF